MEPLVRFPTYFISGHIDLTQEEFDTHYVPKLEAALLQEDVAFVVGDCKGADAMAQDWLGEHSAPGVMVLVFHMFVSPRYNTHRFPTLPGFTTDEQRDSAMTMMSTDDIAWVRPGREKKSGTAKNIARRTKQTDK